MIELVSGQRLFLAVVLLLVALGAGCPRKGPQAPPPAEPTRTYPHLGYAR